MRLKICHTSASTSHDWFACTLRAIVVCLAIVKLPFLLGETDVAASLNDKLDSQREGNVSQAKYTGPFQRIIRGGGSVKRCETGDVVEATLRGAECDDAAVGELLGLTSLEILNVPGAGITDEGCGTIAKMTTLKSLSIGASPITDAGIRKFDTLTQLTRLKIHNANVTGEGVFLSQLKGLRVLVLDYTTISDEGLRDLAANKDLRGLIITSSIISDKGIASLEHLVEMEGCTLIADTRKDQRAKITDMALHSVAKWPKLKGLVAHSPAFTDAGIKSLTSLSNLETLRISGSDDLTNLAVEQVAKMPKLNTLHISSPLINDAAMAHLTKCRFKSLNLSGTSITDAGLAALAKCARINELHVIRTKVTKEGALRFKERHPECRVFITDDLEQPPL